MEIESLKLPRRQLHCQALFSLLRHVVGRKSLQLVAAGYVTTRNLGGKRICWAGGQTMCFDCCCGKLCGFQNLEKLLKTSGFIRVWRRSLPMKKCSIISAVFKKQNTFVHQEIRQPNGAQNFRRLAQVKRYVPNQSETSRSVSWIFKLGGSLFSSLRGILDVENNFCHTAD